MPTSPDTLRELLIGLVFMTLSTASLFTILVLTDFAGTSRFLEPVRNFFNYAVTVMWSTAPSHFTQEMFLVPSTRYGPVRTCKTWVLKWVAFKSHTEWSNVSAPTTTILPTTTALTVSVTWYTRQKLTRTKIWQNIWLTLIFTTLCAPFIRPCAISKQTA